ncbi:hypothetical protein [Hymenobacter metallilatus]|uniref:Secreted protein n=1 Tax=Hymenobacter metallilatus TaxID=2493666 RepID=A0A428JIN7_9BACT|nr:hypothetical protein [Hymenobacter metallilatus]RSK32506.1 hypothetical protein EI290_12315 [Hymenobacter metallilatus]
MKKKLFSSLLTFGLILGIASKASANPMFGNTWGNQFCSGGTLHQIHRIYIFWLETETDVDTGASCPADCGC